MFNVFKWKEIGKEQNLKLDEIEEESQNNNTLSIGQIQKGRQQNTGRPIIKGQMNFIKNLDHYRKALGRNNARNSESSSQLLENETKSVLGNNLASLPANTGKKGSLISSSSQSNLYNVSKPMPSSRKHEERSLVSLPKAKYLSSFLETRDGSTQRDFSEIGRSETQNTPSEAGFGGSILTTKEKSLHLFHSRRSSVLENDYKKSRLPNLKKSSFGSIYSDAVVLTERSKKKKQTSRPVEAAPGVDVPRAPARIPAD